MWVGHDSDIMKRTRQNGYDVTVISFPRDSSFHTGHPLTHNVSDFLLWEKEAAMPPVALLRALHGEELIPCDSDD